MRFKNILLTSLLSLSSLLSMASCGNNNDVVSSSSNYNDSIESISSNEVNENNNVDEEVINGITLRFVDESNYYIYSDTKNKSYLVSRNDLKLLNEYVAFIDFDMKIIGSDEDSATILLYSYHQIITNVLNTSTDNYNFTSNKITLSYIDFKKDEQKHVHFEFSFINTDSMDLYIFYENETKLDLESENTSEFEFSLNDGNNISLDKYLGKNDVVEIPSLENKKYTYSIGAYAFLASSITSVIIPDSVTSIGDGAFYYCKDLTNLEIGSNVSYIDSGAFNKCSNLSNIIVSKNNKYYDSRDNCNAIIKTSTNELVVGSTKTIIPNSVKTIKEYAFYGRDNLISISIPSSIESIEEGAFNDCECLKEIIVAKDNKYYDSRNNCNAIIKTSTNELIFGCYETIIPSSVTSIGKYAFNSCLRLTNITIPSSVITINDSSFAHCDNLTSITIPSSVTYIGEDAFYGCYCLIKLTIPDSVTSIKDRAFYLCSSLTSITLSNSITSIGNNTFYGCTSLTSITIPSSVTRIEEDAFYNCYNMKSVSIPSSVTYIGEHAFCWCNNLCNITYKGNKAQWNAITKGYDWNDNTGTYTIHCTDGDIAKS